MSAIDIHPHASAAIREWLDEPVSATTGQRPKNAKIAVFLVGPPGVGKTTLAKHVLQERGYDTVILNASQRRTEKDIEQLLHSVLTMENTADIFRSPEARRRVAIIMDEVDGMTQGEKGGLNRALKMLREMSSRCIDNPVIFISNTWLDKRFATLRRLCKLVEVGVPAQERVCNYVRSLAPAIPGDTADAIATRYGYDLRKCQQAVAEWERNGHLVPEGNDVEGHDEVDAYARMVLTEQLDYYCRTTLDNKKTNTMGLKLHENMLEFLALNTQPSGPKGPKEAEAARIQLYVQLLDKIAKSDRIDYYTFFFQRWNLFPVSFQLKIQHVNAILFRSDAVQQPVRLPTVLRHTEVLNRQSAQYNQYKTLRGLRQFFGCSFGDIIPMLYAVKQRLPVISAGKDAGEIDLAASRPIVHALIKAMEWRESMTDAEADMMVECVAGLPDLWAEAATVVRRKRGRRSTAAAVMDDEEGPEGPDDECE
jgi:DNA polymerase III delta prime subunit